MRLIQGCKAKGADLQGQMEGIICETRVGHFLCSSTIMVCFVCFVRGVSAFVLLEKAFRTQLVRISVVRAA